MPSERPLQKHIQALTDGAPAARRDALRSLREYDEAAWAAVPDDLTDAITTALADQLVNGEKQASVQRDVATILGTMGPRSKDALPQLLDLLGDGVPELVREAAATAVGKMGKAARGAVSRLVELLGTARPALTAQAVRALGNIGRADEEVRSALVDLWLSPSQSQSTKVQAAIALCKLRVPSRDLLETMTTTLVASPEAPLRKAAAEGLAACGKNERDVVAALLSASLADSNEDVRQMAQAGLDRMRLTPEKAVRVCADQLGDSRYAETALRRSGPLAVPALIEALGKADPATRAKAARTLSCFGEGAAEAVPALTAALHPGDSNVRLAAAKALWNVTSTAELVIPTLIELLRVKEFADGDGGEGRRQWLQTVMEALGRIGPPAAAAVPALKGLVEDKNRHVREAAIASLEKIAPAAATKAVPSRQTRPA